MRQGDAIIDRYVLEEESSRGGMGAVWKAWDLESDHPVAVKLLNALAPDDIERFGREASILAELELPGVVRYIDHGTTVEGEPFLVMEWLDGQTLGQRLERDGLDMGQAVALIVSVCEILAPLHAHGVIHRDLKPENLLIPATGLADVRVIDFGLARRARETHRITQTGVTVGTPGYMAPEQVRGERAVLPSADVFALGCILYECLTGFPAFAGENQIAVQSKILFADPPRLRVLEPRVPAGLEAVVERMLAKAPTLRLPDTEAARAALVELGPVAAGAVKRSRSEPPPTAMLRPPAAAAPESHDHLGLVMAVGSRAADVSNRRTVTPAEVGRREAELDDLVRPFGGRPELFDDGSVVIAFPRAAASELAERAARCALAVQAALPAAVLTVITGALAIDELIDRAAATIAHADLVELFADGERVAGISVEARTAQLLQPRFALRHDPRGWWLLPGNPT